MAVIIETERLILRTWRQTDADAYFKINQDPKTIELLRGPLTMEQVNDFIPAVNNQQEKHGYTLWATELKEAPELIGFIGLNCINWKSHFTPAIDDKLAIRITILGTRLCYRRGQSFVRV
jgi:RimJ/RimL family protein N-acetyltransferase